MRHPNGGQMRAYYDGTLTEAERERVRAHLATCERCARTGATLEARGARVGALLSGLEPHSRREPVSPQVARYRLERRIQRSKESTMLKNVFARRYRPAWAAVAVIAALAIAFCFPPVRALAGDLLGLFRVERIQFIEVNPAQLSDKEALDAIAQKLEGVLEDQVQFELDGEPQTVNEAEVRSLSDYTVRLPAALDGDAQYVVRPSMRASMEVDLPSIRVLLAELGYEDVDLPDSLDGAEVGVAFGTTVIAEYGSCDPESGPGGSKAKCTVLAQMPSPEVSAPPDLDVDRLGQAYLQLLGMTPQEAARFSEHVNWATTLVVPIPDAMSLSYRDVRVDGVVGTLVRSPRGKPSEQEYLMTWVKDGTVYTLHGAGTVSDAVKIGDSLQ